MVVAVVVACGSGSGIVVAYGNSSGSSSGLC